MQQIPLHPLVGLSFFLTEKYRSLAINPLRSDSTIQKLDSITREIFKDHTTENDTLDEFFDVCQRANDQIEQGLSFLRVKKLDTST